MKAKFVHESINNVLIPKSDSEIKAGVKTLGLKEKRDLLWDKGMIYADNEAEELYDLIESTLGKNDFDILLDYALTYLKDIYPDEIPPIEAKLEAIIDGMNDEELDDMIGQVWPEYWNYIK